MPDQVFGTLVSYRWRLSGTELISHLVLRALLALALLGLLLLAWRVINIQPEVPREASTGFPACRAFGLRHERLASLRLPIHAAARREPWRALVLLVCAALGARLGSLIRVLLRLEFARSNLQVVFRRCFGGPIQPRLLELFQMPILMHLRVGLRHGPRLPALSRNLGCAALVLGISSPFRALLRFGGCRQSLRFAARLLGRSAL